jgi:formylglycine-generating enzyme required for sulfatase activity
MMMTITRRSVVGAGLAAAFGEPISRAAAPTGMVEIPAGGFTMGEGQGARRVYLDGFYMAKYQVTNAEYNAFANAAGGIRLPRYWRGGTFPEDKTNHPVLWVSWIDAQKYCAWRSRESGRVVTLPTEAQWEKAARGPQGFRYPWGNDADPRNLNYNGLCARKYGLLVTADGQAPGWRDFTETAEYCALVGRGGFTTPVDAFPQGKSAYGCFDMAGNAWEWCLDWYMRDYFKLADAGRNPQGPSREQADEVNRAAEHGKGKVIRGGSWYAHLSSASSLYRQETRGPEAGYHSVGFRVVING